LQDVHLWLCRAAPPSVLAARFVIEAGKREQVLRLLYVVGDLGGSNTSGSSVCLQLLGFALAQASPSLAYILSLHDVPCNPPNDLAQVSRIRILKVHHRVLWVDSCDDLASLASSAHERQSAQPVLQAPSGKAGA
jgi:hypothetical protein